MFIYYITLLLIPFDNHPLISFNYHGITPIKIAGGLSFLYALKEMMTSENSMSIWKPHLSKLFLLFTAVFFTSLLVNSVYNSSALLRYVSIMVFFVTTMALVNTRERFIKSLVMILICMAIASSYMLREFSLYHARYESFRPGGIFNDPNYSALSILTVIPIAFMLYKEALGKYKKMALLGLLSLYIGAVFLSQSRGGLIGLIVVVLLLLIHLKFKIRNIVLIGILLSVVLYFLPVDITRRLNLDDTGIKVSTESRYALLISGLRMFEDNPVAGVGPGNFKNFVDVYSPDISKKQIAHSSYIELAAELGIMGLLTFLMICRRVLKDLSVASQNTAEDTTIHAMLSGLKIGIVGYLVSAIFLSAEYENILWFYIFATGAMIRFIVPSFVKNSSGREHNSQVRYLSE